MATFDQKIQPINSPSYGSQSHPITLDEGIKPQGVAQNQIMPHGVMQGDTSAAYAGEAAAAGIKSEAIGDTAYSTLFKNITGTADFLGKAGVQLVKKDIENQVYAIADRERQAYTDALEKIKQGVGVTNVLDSGPTDPDASPATPAEVQGLPDTLEALQSARSSGKISGSYYQSRLLAEAKNLRAQYPGFRSEIDQEFAKVTGTNPANAYIHALVQDINTAAYTQSSETSKMLAYIRSKAGYPNADKMYEAVSNGTATSQDVFNWASPYAQQEYQFKLRGLKFNDDKNTREDQQRIAGDNLDYEAGAKVNQAVDVITGKMGLNTAADVDRLGGLEKSGGIRPQDWQAYGQTVASAKTAMITQMTQDADAKGYTKAIGGKAELNKRIAEATKPFDVLLDRIYNHDFGGIYDVQQQLKAQNDQTKQGLLNDPKIGPYWQTVQAVKDIGGEQNLTRFNLDTIKGNFNDDFKSYFKRFSANMASQYTMRTTGIPYTFNDVIDNLKTNKVTDGKFNRAVLGEVGKITDPNVPDAIKENYALAAFSQGNRGMISRLQADGTDVNGRPISGQTAVYQRFTSPQMTKSMYELGKKNPEIWSQYTTWAKETFANELMARELQDLNKIPPDSGVTIGWDAANHRFIPPQKPPINPNDPTKSLVTLPSYYNLATTAVNRINSNMANLKNIAERTGEDPDAFLLKTIADNAGPEVLQNIQGLPYQMIRGMGLGKLRQ